MRVYRKREAQASLFVLSHQKFDEIDSVGLTDVLVAVDICFTYGEDGGVF